ncbi:uncharacterized protein LOC116013111 [Ipomoea triloba]|uniref:uncharacterized protein LOC116013111 n=1 Tax=Ipomoea triloba TaxID=35885 RepID=UPI00125DE1C1|nr:uncharacterized protein LOC116013111 [Ipomoea triloba]
MASSSKQPMDLADEYSAMSLRDDEEFEFPIEEGTASDFLVETPFILAGKLLTEKPTRFNYLKDTMASIWRPKKGMMAKEVSSNMFLFYFVHELDIKKILEGGPWSYDQNLLLLKQIEPNVPPQEIQLTTADFWVQAFNIPSSMQTKKTAEMVGAFLGSFIKVDENNLDGLWKSFMRIRVQMNITKPLKRKMKVKPPGGDTFYIEFKYERLATFCFICGLIGHNERSCDELFEGRSEILARNYGPELRATGRRSQPSAGQPWMLLELPRQQITEETKKSTFTPDNDTTHADIPYEEINVQRAQSDPQNIAMQSGAVQHINERLTSIGSNSMKPHNNLMQPPTAPNNNGFVLWPIPGCFNDANNPRQAVQTLEKVPDRDRKRKKNDNVEEGETHMELEQEDVFDDGSKNLLEAGPSSQARLFQ